MKNWKTTIGGFLAAAGLAMQASDNPTVHTAGWIMAALGAALLGTFAKDKNVTGGSVASTPEAQSRVTKEKV